MTKRNRWPSGEYRAMVLYHKADTEPSVYQQSFF